MHLAVTVFLVAVADTQPAQDTLALKDVLSLIFGVPVTLLAVVGTIYAVPKARRERRKLDLEILEKERALGLAQVAGNPAEVAMIVSEPIFENRRALDLILRFVLLSLVLQAWGIVAGLLGSALASAQFELTRAVETDASIVAIAGYLVVAFLASLPNVVRSLLFVGIGWPLLLDCSRLLRFDLPDFFYTSRTRRLLIVIAVASALMQSFVGIVASRGTLFGF